MGPQTEPRTEGPRTSENQAKVSTVYTGCATSLGRETPLKKL